jgi:hypothetical protein
MNSKHQKDSQDEVAAIITAMTDAEQPFLRDAVDSVLSNPGIGQVVLCIEQQNSWIETVLGDTIADPRLEVVWLPLAPLGFVRNRALQQVRLLWVAYCDGDDVWCQGKTRTQLTAAEASGCDFIGADHFLTNDSGKIRACAPARSLPMPSAWMVRTEVMRQHPFNESPFSLGQEESGEWWNRTSGSVSKARCPNLLLRYRVRASSLSAKTPSMRRKAQIVKLANIPGLGAIILLATWWIWLLNRKTTYVWNESWGQQSSNDIALEMESTN